MEVLCNRTPYLPYVWAPIKLMVQHYEVFESLLAAYAAIGAVLPRFDRYEKAFGEIPSFRVAPAIIQESGNICSQILRTIALQLLRRNLDLASLIANQYVYQGASCSMAQLRILLPEMLETIDSTRIIIDGLNECSEVETQMSILKDLQRLLGKDVGYKIIISSRREEVELDIGLYVKYEVRSIKTTDPKVRAKIESILVEKVNGMFLWVRLVVGELRVCGSDWELEDRAKSLPRGLKKAYGRILDRIMDETHSNYPCLQAIKILEWITYSYRPLKTYELLDSITFKVGCTELNSHTKMRKSVLDSCRPLIEEGPSNTVDFIHFLAKEYILYEEDKQAASFISPDVANLNISFSYVSLDSCSSDTTYFSDTRHTYQETLEALLSPSASDLFPGLDRRALDNFANIYGPFRCDDASCASFATGFTTRNALSRHNEKWHRVVTEFATLLVLLPRNPSTRGRSQSSTPRFDRRISDQRSRSGLLSKKQTHKGSIEEGTTKAMKGADNRTEKVNELPSSEGWHNFAAVIPVMIQDSMAEAAPKVPISQTPIAPLGDKLSPEERAVLEAEYAALNTAETGEENETMIENATQESPGQQGESDIGLDHGLSRRHRSNSLSVRRGNNLPNPSPDVMIEHRNQLIAGNTPINPGGELKNLMEITGGTNIAASLAIGDVALRTHQSLPHYAPTVGEKLDIQSQGDYLGDSALEHLQALAEPILSFRPVSNNGDSTWLIPMFCYFESLASFRSSAGLIIKGEVERIGNISLTPSLYTEYRYSPYEPHSTAVRNLSSISCVDCPN
ncbi:hypothetical protein DL95DRAFT_520678 [Leptodontidium sp. 2 PMI_412]|nr:hypothetical protein DL95DRAFT_520678 [Leptodontidium sp. 2 PMI_412]